MTHSRSAVVRLALAGALILAAASACGADDATPDGTFTAEGDATVVVANSAGTLTTAGPQRVLVALVGEGPNQFLGDPETPARIAFRPIDGADDDEMTVTGEWLSQPGVPLGLYVADIEFDRTGFWEVTVEGNANGPAAVVEVVDDASVPARGEPAPPSLSPTGSTAEEILAISTDPEPRPEFYELTVADAVSNGRPTMVVFATPAFCRTATCGPTVEMVKGVADRHPDLDVVHVEPFDVEEAREGTLVPVPLMDEWGIVTEPWVFVVDADGLVSASFEGILAEHELDEAIAGL